MAREFPKAPHQHLIILFLNIFPLNDGQLGTDNQKSYGGGGIFEPQEFFFVIKFLYEFFRPQHEHFLGLIGVQEFFSFNFPLREYFLVLRPPPNKFSNGSSLRKVMVGGGKGDFLRCIGYFLLTFSLYEFFRSGLENFIGLLGVHVNLFWFNFPLCEYLFFLYFARLHAT